MDIATLTGSIAVALGNINAGIFATDDSVRDALAAGSSVYERVWPMPLMPEYRKAIDSDTADMKNSAGAKGGACVAAAFLKEFVDYPRWAHVDIRQSPGFLGEPLHQRQGHERLRVTPARRICPELGFTQGSVEDGAVFWN